MTASVTRRSAVSAAAAVVVGGIVGFAYGRNSDARKRPAASTGYGGYGGSSNSGTQNKPIAAVADIPADGGLIKSGVVLVQDGGTVKAFSSTCTHLGCTVNKVSHGKIFCPCHGSVFNASTGAVVQGPASKPLPAVPVTVTNGEVFPA